MADELYYDSATFVHPVSNMRSLQVLLVLVCPVSCESVKSGPFKTLVCMVHYSYLCLIAGLPGPVSV